MSRRETSPDEFAYLDELSERLRKSRKDVLLTIEQMAARMDMTISTISRYESGSHAPSAYALKKWADITGVSGGYLLEGEE
jgi:transcriptional regulator with XRE-family HTH domain